MFRILKKINYDLIHLSLTLEEVEIGRNLREESHM